MKTEKIKKGLSLFLVVLMLLTMMPAVGFIPEVEATYPMMKEFTASSSSDFHAYWNKVYSATFLDKIDNDAIAGAFQSWDISKDEDGSVMAWMYLNEEATAAAKGAARYDVYIAGEGGVGANPNSGFIFYFFSELVEVNGLEYFKTETATTFKCMFENCYKVKHINFKNNNTENLTSMENMFKNCYEIEVIDLSSFNTSKVTTMRFAFYLCKKLNYIYAGNGWSTESLDSLYDGVFNCCYAKFGVTETQYAEDIKNGKQYDASASKATFEEGGYLTYKAPETVLPEKYTVTYKFIGDIIPEGVTAPAAATYEEGTTVTVADSLSVDKYIFSGWSTDDATVENGEFVISNDVEFVGSWTKLYKVEYKYDDNYELPQDYPEIPEVELWFAPGEDVPVYGIPYAHGYIFVGWNTGDAEVIGDSFLMPENDVVLYGYYKIPVNSIEISGGDLTVDIGGEKVRVEVIIDPPDATFDGIIYESGDENIVKVGTDGSLEPVGVGTTTITITSVDDPSKTDTVNVTVKIPVTDITVDRTSIDLNKGDTDKITVTEVLPEKATNKEVTYVSSDETVVKVDEDGNITAVSDGTAIITVTSKDNKTVKETVTVTVKTPVTDITVPENDITVNVGDEQNIGAEVTPKDATNPELTYDSDNPGVAKIDNYGNVIAVGEGTATITITSKDNPSITETVTVTVKIPVEDITVEKNEITLSKGDTDKIEVTFTPNEATDKELTYESSDETVVKVDENGNIEAVGKGEATITITSKDNPSITETVKVTVEIPVEDIITDREEIILTEGDKDTIKVTVTPDDATNKNVTYESKNPDVVTVDKDGNITAVSEGEAEIIVKTEDGEKTVTVKVTVEKPVVPVEKVEVEKDEFTLVEGGTDKIIVTVTPDDATNKNVTYESKNPDVVTVDKDGNITAVSEGEAEIIVKTEDGEKTVTVKVTVEKPVVPVEKVEVEKDEFTLVEGGTDKIIVTVTPNDATNKKVTYESKNSDVVTVDKDGNITAVSEGEAEIIVKTEDGEKTVTVKVTVKKPVVPVEKVEVENDEFTLVEGGTDKIIVTVTPDDATNKKVTYTSSDESIVKVDENGNIEAVKEGTATITVTTEDGDKTVTVKVTVNKEEPTEPDEPEVPDEPEYSIQVTEEITIDEGKTQLVYVKVTPNDGSLSPTFTSADESIAKVDEFGNVTGISAGITTIYVSFPNGEVRPVIVTVLAPAAPGVPSIPKTHYICFGKTDGIGWYEVSINGGDFFPQGPNSTLEVEEGSILVVRLQDMWIDDEFDFYVNGDRIESVANTITVVVDGYMLIGALSMDVEVPDVDESLNIFQRIIRAIKDFFQMIGQWFGGWFK